MAHWLLEASLAACALVLCFVLAWRTPLFALALSVAAGVSLWAQPHGELVLRVVVLGAAMLGAMAATPRLSAPLVALVELGGDRWRARGRRSALRAHGGHSQVSGMGRSSH